MLPATSSARHTLAFMLLLWVALLSGCDSAGESAPEPDPASYMPLEVGNTWTYRFLTGTDVGAVVSDQVTIDGTAYFAVTTQVAPFPITLRTTDDGRLWYVNDGSEYLLADFTWREDDAPMVDLGAPRPNFPDDLSTVYTVAVERNLRVTTPAGTFDNALRLRYTLPELDDEAFSYTFAPNAGIIQIRRGLSGDRPLFQMSSGTIGGESVGDGS